MKYFKLTFILSFLIWQESFAQDADSTIATFKIRKPETKEPELKKPAGRIYITDEFCSIGISSDWTVKGNLPASMFDDEFKGSVLLKFEYPEAAIDGNISGEVRLGYEMDELGKPVNIKVLKGAHAILDEAAMALLRNIPPWPTEVVKEIMRAERKAFFTIDFWFVI